ncbi:MAG: ornithine carbamoyltransferase [Gemmatimonadales bacterium]|nr:MAG: ornithine carbamoyltransferase [Gemmatimonadales bacterium]
MPSPRNRAGKPRHFLQLGDLSREELLQLLDRAVALKAGSLGRDRPLDGVTLALIFRKSSTRTRVSFEVGIHQLGGHGVFLSDRDSQLGRGEPIPDTARVLSGYVNGIMVRTFGQDEVEELAANASVPVINGLTDRYHPCQLLADLLTIREAFDVRPSGWEALSVAWVGDGNNMANSWLNAARVLGFELRLAVPEGFDPHAATLARARESEAMGSGRIVLTRDPAEAVAGAHVVTTDVWASMGQEDEADDRTEAFRPFQVNAELFDRARAEAIFLHCLPAHRGEEVTAEVIDGPRSRVFQESENRLHAQKALLLQLLAP